jgi:hypothetical protein
MSIDSFHDAILGPQALIGVPTRNAAVETLRNNCAAAAIWIL